LRVVIKHSVINLKSLLTVLCVNMSKISWRKLKSWKVERLKTSILPFFNSSILHGGE